MTRSGGSRPVRRMETFGRAEGGVRRTLAQGVPRRGRPRGAGAVRDRCGTGWRFAGMRIEVDRPRISLCMIVRDNARTLPACLESIRPWVDEMVIVDTGSVDETPRIVESFWRTVVPFPLVR